MFDIIELNGKKVAELREIASKLGITRVDKLKSKTWFTASWTSKPLSQAKAKSSPRQSLAKPSLPTDADVAKPPTETTRRRKTSLLQPSPEEGRRR